MIKGKRTIGLFILSLSSVTYALDPLGPPLATVGRHNWSFGIEYAYSDADTMLSNIISSGVPEADTPSRGLKTQRAYAKVRYGLLDRLDVFGRVGATTLESRILLASTEFDGDAGIAWGFGAAATLYDSERFDWGVLAQWSHGESGADQLDANHARLRDMETDCLQIATGPTIRVRDDLNVFAGGFYHTLRGEYENSFDGVVNLRFDMEEDASWGGFAGLDWAVQEDVRFHIEAQHTGTALAIAAGLHWLLQ